MLTVALFAGVDVPLQGLRLGELGEHLRQQALALRLLAAAVVALGELQ